MNVSPLHSWVAVAAVAVMAGCSSGVKLNQTPIETRTPTPVEADAAAGATGGGASSGVAPQSNVAGVNLTAGGAAAQATLARVVYFDFDSFVVKDEFRPVVEAQARRLVADKRLRLVAEGHTDERGSREYNLALGQKRADAVVRNLELLGAAPAQTEAVSYGEERPAVTGSDEAAWAKNRRVELKDR